MVETEREKFLINMYNQMWNNINRHINLVWQPLGLLITTIGSIILAENNLINFDLAVTLIIIFCGWFIAHVYDSSHWFNRNLVILTNIEKQFLNDNDEKEIHYYFKRSHQNKMITHFKLQEYLGYTIMSIIILYHFFKRASGFGNIANFESIFIFVPYLIFILILVWLLWFRNKKLYEHDKLISRSPGK